MRRMTVNTPFTETFEVCKIETVKISGVNKKKIVSQDKKIKASYKSYSSQDTNSNGIIIVNQTILLHTWYNKNIDQTTILIHSRTNKKYEVIGVPENIEMRSQYMEIRVQEATGSYE